MDQEVEGPEGASHLPEGLVHGGVVGDVGGDQGLHPDALGQGAHPPLQRLALVGEGHLRALGGQLAGDAPGDGILVGDAHDEALLAPHQLALGQLIALVRHAPSSWTCDERPF